MISEYAVDPEAIGSDWRIFKDLIDRFGSDKGRVISRFPKKWEQKVVRAAKNSNVPEVRILSIIERLKYAKHKIADCHRIYEANESWIENSRREHHAKPFRGIITEQKPHHYKQEIEPDDCSDQNEFLQVITSLDIERTAESIAEAVSSLAKISKHIDIIDPFFDLRPTKGKYAETLVALFELLSEHTGSERVVRLHFRTHDSRPPIEMLAGEAKERLGDCVPPSTILEFFEWSEIQGGEDFHDRFFLSEAGGMMIGAGFSADGASEKAAIALLDFEHTQSLRARFEEGSSTYQKVGKACRLNPDGSIELF